MYVFLLLFSISLGFSLAPHSLIGSSRAFVYQYISQSRIDSLNIRERLKIQGRQEFSVGIVGGGFSGLFTAFMLHCRYPNAKISVFEFKSHIGGILAYSDPSGWELGALRFPDAHKPLLDVFDILGITLEDFIFFREDAPVIDADGQLKLYKDLHHDDSAYQRILGSIGENIEKFPFLGTDYDNKSLACYMEEKVGDIFEVDRILRSIYPFPDWGHKGVLEHYIQNKAFRAKKWFRVREGVNIIPKKLQQNLPKGVIRLNHQVKRIEEKEDSVRLFYSVDKVIKSEEFSYVVLAVPPKVYDHLEVVIEGVNLSKFIAHMGQFPLVRASLKFKSKFWKPGGYSEYNQEPYLFRMIVYPSDEGVFYIHFYGALRAHNYLEAEFKRTGRSKRDIAISCALQELKALYPEQEFCIEKWVDLTLSYVIDWHDDLSGGIQLFNPGDWNKQIQLHDILAWRVFLAGEIGGVFHGWLMAPLLSAIQAVERIEEHYLGRFVTKQREMTLGRFQLSTSA